tara:strand:+ start:688 stop:1644 length:957 start_codon:yes stop_codon:yes gene_type:complete
MTKPFIIAEVGSNFDQSLSKAKKFINVAKKCGADAIKFQLFSGKVLYPDNKKMQKIFNQIELNINWIDELKKYANKTKIILFFSCFDELRLKMLIKKNFLLHKIASSEIENFKLIKNLNKKKFTVFLSTGMCDLDDIKKASKIINNSKLVLMQCTSLYPTSEKDTNLNVIETFKKKFKKIELGFSDHTISDISAITSVGMGVRYFEKHITLNKKSKGPDHFYAYEPDEFQKYIKNIHSAYRCLGTSKKEININVRKIARLNGIYSKIPLDKNIILKKKDIVIKSPALGLREKELKLILGKKLRIAVKRNKPLKLEFFK